ncbi:exodeoxyribonuclease V subunit alpha [Pelagibaculum spongiae]|uniref:RecBCD enzyme subunit RecD n=1 Tax=Pelagibaculum spongiae TaxID=2080658 RepID=A0A2V1GNP0_9GAMM|nr:exodeoxyribonuclease V subunit alpha [Pelagibaculum spongiae]PVZ63860.1 exodeoxyribonuclease V subunit alpha [Pelagibaculum spongiae]
MTSQNTTIVSQDRLPSHPGQALSSVLLRLASDKPNWLTPLIDQLCNAIVQGHSCLELTRLELIERLADGTRQPYGFPALPQLTSQLQSLNLVSDDPKETAPLMLDLTGQAPRLYLYRYWQFELMLIQQIKLSADKDLAVDSSQLLPWLQRLFPTFQAEDNDVDWQLIAALSALLHRFCVISGGPGTGKTTTVIKILALLVALSEQPLKIALAAPTGKAAGRLEESIRQAIVQLGDQNVLPSELIEKLPQKATTLHRLLGVREFSNEFRHGKDNPLQLDLLVVDEGSMVDLALMYRLISALPANCQLILLGDRNQLASVEAGSVLADICSLRPQNCFNRAWAEQLKTLGIELPDRAIADQPLPLSGNIVLLEKSWRFDEKSAIGQLANAVNHAQPERALQLLQSDQWPDIQWLNPETNSQLSLQLDQLLLKHYLPIIEAENAQQALTAFNDFRMLAALRNGNFGVTGLNKRLERLLIARGKIDAANVWYKGRPIIISQNDYALDLYNGDIGICWPEASSENIAEQFQPKMRVYFPLADGSLRQVSPARLPAHQTAWAMTVHKSQGSEFKQCLLVLPESLSPVVSRDLVYTAITRAKKSFQVLVSAKLFTQAIKQQQQRFSGLADKLSKRG